MTQQDVLDYLLRQARIPFAWGTADCVQFAAGMVELARGERPALPTYASEIEAKRWLADRGGLEAAVSAVLGPAERDLRLCGDGDIVLSAFEGRQTLGVCLSRLVFVRREQNGSDFDPALLPVDIETAGIRWWPCRSF